VWRWKEVEGDRGRRKREYSGENSRVDGRRGGRGLLSHMQQKEVPEKHKKNINTQ